jgi:transcriptional regulator with XRE-family HTH domain
MGIHERRRDRANRRADAVLEAIGRELLAARVNAGLSQSMIGSVAGLSYSQVGRIERALSPRVGLRQLILVSEALGLDLSVRLYPVGDPIRDRAQRSLLERLRGQLHPALGWQTEVLLGLPGDSRAWDAVIRCPEGPIAVEAETRLYDVQALERKIALKRQDSGIDHVVLLVADTKTNRRVLRAARESLRSAFPLDGRVILASLAAGHRPGASGIVLL